MTHKNCRLITVGFFVVLLSACGQKDLELTIPIVDSSALGLPSGASHKAQFSVDLEGSGSSVIYKVGIAGTTDCQSLTGYSSAQANGASIALDVSSLPDGEVALCTMGVNASGKKGTPVRKTWFKDTSAIEYIGLSQTEVRVDEAAAILDYVVSMSTTKSYDVKIQWERVDGDGIYGVHHMLASSGSAIIPAGQTTVHVQIPILENTDATGEKYFGLRLMSTNSTRVHVGPDYQVLVYVKDNDGGQASRLVKVFTNQRDACALYVNGSVKCWGNNESYVQGNTTGGYLFQSAHVITGLSTGVTDLSSGGIHFCALMSDQTVRCWGEGSNGQLGGGGTSDSSTLVTPAISTVTQIALTERSSCALKADGTVWCWGKNNYGQVGDGTTAQKLIPTQVLDLPGPASSIAAGWQHVCALVSGTVYCWGRGSNGALGTGATANKTKAFLVSGLVGVNSIHAGTYSTCALVSGAATCWGTSNGGLGTGNTTELSPVALPGFSSGVTDIGFSENYGCLIKSGELYCIDSQSEFYRVVADGYGFLSSSDFRALPFAGTQNLKLHIPVSGWNTGCVEDSNHSFRCFENGNYNAGWFLTQRDTFTPVEFKIVPHDHVKKIEIGKNSSCVLDQEKSLWCWGRGSFPQSGDERSTANGILVKSLEGRVDDFVHAFYGHSICAIVDGGDVYCWGDNNFGQFGVASPTYSNVPVKITGISTATKISHMGDSLCVLLSDKTVKCWGANYSGQLGNGTGADSLTPVVATGLSSVEDLVGYGSGSCARTTGGAVYCWGSNWAGAVGDGNSGTDALSPIQVVGLSSGAVEIVATNRGAFCARMNTGDVKCWGNGDSTGDGTGANSDTPVTAILPLAATKLYKGPCARLSDDSLYCWGENYAGQMTMDGHYYNSWVATPAPFIWSGHTIEDTFSSMNGRCLKTTEGKYYCWGYNNNEVNGDMKFDANKAIISNKWFEQ